MRLQELNLPLAVMHPEFLAPVKAWGDMFEKVSLQSVEQEYFLKVTVFDISGNQYAAEAVDVLSRVWWAIPFHQGVRIDIRLRKTGTLSVEELKACFEAHLQKNPTWWINNDGVWTSKDIAGGFGSGNSCHEVIERLDWFAREVN